MALIRAAANGPILALVVGCATPALPPQTTQPNGVEVLSNRSALGTTGTAIRWPDPERTHFAPLCLPAHYRCIATAISADGTTVVGADNASDVLSDGIPVRWRAGQMEALGGGDLRATWAEAVSADGRTIVGSKGVGADGDGLVWIGDDPPVVLVDPVGVTDSRPKAISGDGTVIVGLGTTRQDEGYSLHGAAVRWRVGKPEALRDGGEILWLSSIAVSADGGVVAGTDPRRGGLRIQGEQINRLESGSYVAAISGDGRVLVGLNGDQAMRWHRQPQSLGRLPGAKRCEARGVSHDGSRIVGLCTGRGVGEIAFIWDDASGMQSVAAVLNANGVAAPGWILHGALGISADGVTLVGNGSHGGKDEAWIATIPR